MYIEFQEICTQVSRKYSDDCIYRVGTISDTRTTTIENDKYYSMILTINILNFVHNNVWLNLKTKNDILYIYLKKRLCVRIKFYVLAQHIGVLKGITSSKKCAQTGTEIA